MGSHLQILTIALIATIITLIGDMQLYNAARTSGNKALILLIIGSFLFGISAIVWYFAFKKLTFSGVVILYMFLSIIISVGIDTFKYKNTLGVEELFGIIMLLAGIWLLKGYMI